MMARTRSVDGRSNQDHHPTKIINAMIIWWALSKGLMSSLLQPAARNKRGRRFQPQTRGFGGWRPATVGRCGATPRRHRSIAQPLAMRVRILGNAGLAGEG